MLLFEFCLPVLWLMFYDLLWFSGGVFCCLLLFGNSCVRGFVLLGLDCLCLNFILFAGCWCILRLLCFDL